MSYGRTIILIFISLMSINASAYADCPACFEFYRAKVIKKDGTEISGYIRHNNYGYGGKSSPFDFEKKGKITLFKKYYDISQLPFITSLRRLRPSFHWMFVFVNMNDVIDINSSEIKSIIDEKYKSDLYNARASLIFVSDKLIKLITERTPYAMYMVGRTNVTLISYNKQYDTTDKLKQFYQKCDINFFQESSFTKSLRLELEKKYETITDKISRNNKIEGELFSIGNKHFLDEFESNDMVLFKEKDEG